MSYINQCNNNLFFSLNFFFWLLPTTYTMRFALILCSLPFFYFMCYSFPMMPEALWFFFFFILLFVISFISTPSLLDFNLNAIDWCRHIWIMNTLLDKLAAMKWAKKKLTSCFETKYVQLNAVQLRNWQLQLYKKNKKHLNQMQRKQSAYQQRLLQALPFIGKLCRLLW